MLRSPMTHEMPLSSEAPTARGASALAAPVLALLFAAVFLMGCPPKSPEEAVTATRGQYKVSLESFFPKVVDEPEVIEEAGTEMDGADADGAVDEESEEGEEGADETDTMVMDVPPAPPTLLFELLLVFSGDESLPGVTLDFTHADSTGTEKGSWRQYVETPGMHKGEAKQVTVERELESYIEGDQVSVQLLSYVADEDRSEYREYAEAGQ